jgi:hypothetical protein
MKCSFLLSEAVRRDIARLAKAFTADDMFPDHHGGSLSAEFRLGFRARRAKEPSGKNRPLGLALTVAAFDCLCDEADVTKEFLSRNGIIIRTTVDGDKSDEHEFGKEVLGDWAIRGVRCYLIDRHLFDELNERLGIYVEQQFITRIFGYDDPDDEDGSDRPNSEEEC